jgi:phage terminase Nu1 subunit (DNA packaging protein)
MEQLGEAMNVKQVASLLGCSAWTVRQKHLRQGLPCFRTGPSGRLTFYRNQVVAWVLEKQKQMKGGTSR